MDLKPEISHQGLSSSGSSRAIHNFLRKINYDLTTSKLSTLDPSVAQLSRAYLTAKSLRPAHLTPLLSRLDLGLTMADCYAYHSLQNRVYIALYTAFITYVDDLANTSIHTLKCFSVNVISGASSGEPVLDLYARFLAEETPKFYGPFATASIITATLGHANSCILESELELPHNQALLLENSVGKCFPKWLRDLSGCSVPYTLFIFPEGRFPEDKFLVAYTQVIPGVAEIIDRVNDVLSFYKESVAGDERANYICLRAQEESKEVMDVLERCCEEVASLDKGVRGLLFRADEDGGLLKVYARFFEWFVGLHVSHPRYRLKELGIIHGGRREV
ncbi:hypothetical protein B0O99DRAFT_685787 [Bisporella sp. PMI_857]|nr:hypothetical protein B0O99DRAFT_685787 [Bisporella sp. PMI_857]